MVAVLSGSKPFILGNNSLAPGLECLTIAVHHRAQLY